MKNLILVLVVILTSIVSGYSQIKLEEDLIYKTNSFYYFYEKVITLEDTVGYFEDGGGMIDHEIKISKDFDHIEIKGQGGVKKYTLTIDTIDIDKLDDGSDYVLYEFTTNKDTKLFIEFIDNKITSVTEHPYNYEKNKENGMKEYGYLDEEGMESFLFLMEHNKRVRSN